MHYFVSKSSGKRDLLTLVHAAARQYTGATEDRKAGKFSAALHLSSHEPSNRERHFHRLFVIQARIDRACICSVQICFT